MARRTEAYVDTSAFIALADRSDSYHALFRRLFSEPPGLVSTPLVIAEGQGWFLRRYDRYRAAQFTAMIELMEAGPLELIASGAAECRSAANLARRYSDQDLTLVDALGLHLLESGRFTQCWSTDFHLGLTGTPLIIHQH